MWVFYHLQGNQGESTVHPNAFKLPDTGEKPKLRDITTAFPIQKGAYHFRFRVNSKRTYLWADVTDPNQTVPQTGGKIIIKVLRLGTVSVPLLFCADFLILTFR
jgi:hypothetical protein